VDWLSHNIAMGQKLFTPKKGKQENIENETKIDDLSIQQQKQNAVPENTSINSELVSTEPKSERNEVIMNNSINAISSDGIKVEIQKPISPPDPIDEDLSQLLADTPPDIISAIESLFPQNEKVEIKLMPHQHTLFCERKVYNQSLIRFYSSLLRNAFVVQLVKFKKVKS
jgi:hypothetical protein